MFSQRGVQGNWSADFFFCSFCSGLYIIVHSVEGCSRGQQASTKVETNIGKIPLVVEASQYSQRNERISFGMFQTLLELQRKLN